MLIGIIIFHLLHRYLQDLRHNLAQRSQYFIDFAAGYAGHFNVKYFLAGLWFDECHVHLLVVETAESHGRKQGNDTRKYSSRLIIPAFPAVPGNLVIFPRSLQVLSENAICRRLTGVCLAEKISAFQGQGLHVQRPGNVFHVHFRWQKTPGDHRSPEKHHSRHY